MLIIRHQHQPFRIARQHRILLLGRQPAIQRQQKANVFHIVLRICRIQRVFEQIRALQQLFFRHGNRCFFTILRRLLLLILAFGLLDLFLG